MKYLIVNADDFGLSPEVSRGVIEAHLHGVVTDTTVLILSPFAEESIKDAKIAGLPVGIHVDFVTAFHDGQHTKYAGIFGPDGLLTRELYEREFNHHVVHSFTCEELISLRNEIRRQIEIYKGFADDKPSHLDYHFGLHFLPEVMAIYLTVAEEYGIPFRWGSQYAGTNPCQISTSVFCDEFSGSSESTPEDFIKLIDKNWDGVMEICCHPGYYTPSGVHDSNNRNREYELKILTDPNINKEIEKRDIRLVNYHFVADQWNE